MDQTSKERFDQAVKDATTPGIITEQGYVAGNGLGFQPLSEADKEKLKELNDKSSD